MKKWPAPAPGDIVWCHFPQAPNQPGPKPRPALIIAIDNSDPANILVRVAYGTSRKTDKLYSGEFLVSRQNQAGYALAGLSHDTKFDLKQLCVLPYTSDWFDVAPGSTVQTPVLGTLHPSLMKALTAAYQAATN